VIALPITRSRRPILSEQYLHHAEPFRIEWLSANGLSRPTIPVCLVVLIAFSAMREPTNRPALRPCLY
jgi:hypothetical protein